MTDLTPEDMEKLLHKVLDERTTIDKEKHHAHHEWVEEQIKCMQARRKRMEQVTTTAIQWSVPVILGALWYYIQHGEFPK